jgi:hypothetical protein
MRLMPSQIAALIENGNHNFRYRFPQSDKVIPSIRLSHTEMDSLKKLGHLCFSKTHNILKGDAIGLQFFGCCGDCEQWLFETWVDIIAEILGKKPKSAKRRVAISGAHEFEDIMIKSGYSKSATRNCIANLRTFLKKARKAQSEKLSHQPGHFKTNS